MITPAQAGVMPIDDPGCYCTPELWILDPMPAETDAIVPPSIDADSFASVAEQVAQISAGGFGTATHNPPSLPPASVAVPAVGMLGLAAALAALLIWGKLT